MSIDNVRRRRALVLKGGTVVDGTGAARFVADVRIVGERIAAVGAHLETQDSDVLGVARVEQRTETLRLVIRSVSKAVVILLVVLTISGQATAGQLGATSGWHFDVPANLKLNP